MRELIINGKRIADDTDCYVVAEIGHNHQGDLQKAKEMLKSAKECGCDAVKLQKRHNKTLYTSALYDSAYENENSFGETYGKHREALEFGKKEYVELKKYADELGLVMFATAWDFKSADFLADLEMPAYKIASGDVKNTPLLKHVAKIGKPVIVSTGGATMDDVKRVYDTVMPVNSQLCILQCTAQYPADFKDLNLKVIETFRRQFPDIVIGLSDHENGIAMAIAAYVLGARVIEKHFTLNHTMKGTDHAFSLEPIGMRKLVRDLKRLPPALGDGVKRTYESEKKPLLKMGKKIVAAKKLPAGHVIKSSDVAFKSPGDGLPPCDIEKVIGKKMRKALKIDDALTLDVLK